jgi:hypothetical protein
MAAHTLSVLVADLFGRPSATEDATHFVIDQQCSK